MSFRSILSLCLLLLLLVPVAAVGSGQNPAGLSMEPGMAVAETAGVTVFLKDGREFTGRLLEEKPHRITIEAVISGIKVEMTFGANEVDSIERHPDELPPARRPAPKPAAADAGLGEGGWVVVPAHGTIGVELTRNFFENCVSKAVSAGAEVIIFELKSPGGYLYSLDEIYEALEAERDDIKIVFYVNDECFSAAALLCITSDSFFVGPGALFGSAVVIKDNGKGGADAVNAKYASAQAAIWRTRAERRGRPGILVNAMMLMETELWADKSASPWKLFASKPGGEGARAEIVVTDRSILSMTAAEAVALGAADGAVDDIEHLLRELELKNPEREALSGESQARTVIRGQQRRLTDLEGRLDFIDGVIARINEGIKDETITLAQFRRDLVRVRGGLDRVRREMEQTDYLRFQCLLRGVTYELIEEWKTVIDEALRQTR